MSQKIKPGHVLVEVVQGVEGPSLSIGDNDTGERVAGPKPWGGGRTIHSFQVAAKDLVRLAKEYASAEPSAPDLFQQRVQPWLMECFGAMIAGDREERNHRFLEEALELVQSLGCSADEAHQLVEYVYGRPVGDPSQEVGGVMVTLAALCLANDLDMHQLADTELARVWTKVDQIREKQKSKPQVGPLPGVYPGREAAAPVERDERPAFESWCAVIGYTLKTSEHGNGFKPGYGSELFSAWQARAALERKSSDDIPDFTPGNGNKAERRATALLAQLQSDLTARDERIDRFEQALIKIHKNLGGTLEQYGYREEVEALLWPDLNSRPEERGTPETEPCSGCGTPGWKGACNKCIPY
ncbi:hypothetical protein [Pseudomonas putida]|uniref:hypothetical protein n=1 Tax=Pseudomonas putida TaxID=303 RepID=UPI0007B97DBA|nr:hypothetical protein [Pseudomonas putida]